MKTRFSKRRERKKRKKEKSTRTETGNFTMAGDDIVA